MTWRGGGFSDLEWGTSVTWRGGRDLIDVKRGGGTSVQWRGGTSVSWRGGTSVTWRGEFQ